MRSLRTIAPLALGLVALAVAGCQSRPDQPPAPGEGLPPPPTVPDVGMAAPSDPAEAVGPAPTPLSDPAPATLPDPGDAVRRDREAR
jgi:hypothetical protein